MKRRAFLGALGGALGYSLAARAQQRPMPVIGFLGIGSPGVGASVLATFRQGLAETGYVEGQNVVIEYRWARGQYDQLPALAAELVGRKVNLIVTSGGSQTAIAARRTTSTIPIVFETGGDPVADGLVASLARPGGNVTGFSIGVVELMPKRLELLTEVVPQAKVIAVLVNPNYSNTERIIREMQKAADAKRVQVLLLKAGTGNEIDAAFASLVQLHGDALIIAADPFLSSRGAQMVALAKRYAIPVIYQFREVAASGGLISFAPNLATISRQVGIYAGRMLNGERPADLPVQLPTNFELVINLKTAKALGLTIPQSILARADEVIE